MKRLVAGRVQAVLMQEFIQMRRDRLTFGMIIGVPILQLLLFGYAINNDPKHLPTALFINDHSAVTRSITNALENSRYFDIVESHHVAALADESLQRGDVAFVVTIPEGFTHKLLRGERPSILIEADATDPSAAVNALAAVNQLTAGRCGICAWNRRASFLPQPPSRRWCIAATTRKASPSTTSSRDCSG